MDLEWHKRAHNVACFDVVLTTIRLVSFYFLTVKKFNINPILMRVDVEAFLLSILITVGPFLSLVFLSLREIWTSVRLMMATKIILRSDAVRTIKASENWLGYSIVLLVTELVQDVFNGMFILAGISLVIRGIFIYDVCNFVIELRRA